MANVDKTKRVYFILSCAVVRFQTDCGIYLIFSLNTYLQISYAIAIWSFFCSFFMVKCEQDAYTGARIWSFPLLLWMLWLCPWEAQLFYIPLPPDHYLPHHRIWLHWHHHPQLLAAGCSNYQPNPACHLVSVMLFSYISHPQQIIYKEVSMSNHWLQVVLIQAERTFVMLGKTEFLASFPQNSHVITQVVLENIREQIFKQLGRYIIQNPSTRK